MSNCLKLTNNIDVSNGKYIIENNFSSTAFGVYVNSNSSQDYYKFLNVPKEYPLGFYIDSCANLNNNNNIYNDISSIINYKSDITENIKIYVSRGNDLSFNNGDYFRFYDESFNLLNISQTNVSTNNFLLTTTADNFYFMKGVSYEFISAFDFSNTSPFGINGNYLNLPLILNNIDNSFILYIDDYSNVINSNNKLYYYDLNKQDISGYLEFLIDSSGVNYYYGTIKFQIMNSFPSDVSLSIKSYPKYNTLLSDISNKSFFKHNNECNYVIEGKNFQQYSLNNNDSECLTRISRADICLNDSKVFYEFNKETHNNLIKPILDRGDLSLNDLKYGLYYGSYIIFDICKNYPITISSEFITIDENYIYSKKYENYSNEVENLGEEYNKYKIHNYYYNAIKFTINENNSSIIDTNSFELYILDLLNNKINDDTSKNLIYTDNCQGICGETNFLETILKEDFSFNLINQGGFNFGLNNFNNSENIYKLNIYEEYKEPEYPYYIIDKYGHHNLQNLSDISLIISTIPKDLSDTIAISNNYDNSFVISYNFTYFDLSVIQLTRIVEIVDDVFIDISNTIEKSLFKNQSKYSNIIEISSNIFNTNYNFFNNIDIFIKINKSKKIYLPFSVTISGNYYDENKNNILFNTANDSIIDFKSNNKNTNSNIINFKNLNYYLSNHIYYNEINNNNNIISINTAFNNAFTIVDISNTNVINNNFFKLLSPYIFSNSNDISNNNNNNIIIKGKDNILINNLIIYDISNSINEDNKYNNIIYLQAKNNSILDFDLSFILNFYNENNIDKFNLQVISNSDLNQKIQNVNFNYSKNDSFTISGEFFANDFFYNKNIESILTNFRNKTLLIDTSFNANYKLKIDVKGLQIDDFLYNQLTNIYGINKIYSNLSQTFDINLIDIIKPKINFFNNATDEKRDTYEFSYPYTSDFNILNNILFLNENKAVDSDYNNENPNIPIIVYDENSIYDISISDISYNIIESQNINIVNKPTIFTTTKNTSATIVYKVKDFANNYSNDISLEVKFINIPALTICGEQIVRWNINENYYDMGITIDGIYYNKFPIDSSQNDSSNAIFDNEQLGNKNYDISYNLTFDSTKIGNYFLEYEINYYDDNTNNAKIKRFISLQDTIKPYIRLFDLSNHNFSTIDLSADERINASQYTDIYNKTDYIDYTIDNSNSYSLDFSLTFLSKFEDLSTIIYAFDLSDNYFGYTPTLDISLCIGDKVIKFNDGNFDKINDMSYNGYFYLNEDDRFQNITLTSDNKRLESLIFNYKLTDICNNIFTFNRKVDIVDITKPTIDFSFNELNNNYYIDNSFVIYNDDNNKRDFSYQAININKHTSKFIEEISNIIFNFRINDNYANYQKENLGYANNWNLLQNNYSVTLSNETINKKFLNIIDLSNTILNQENENIRNLFKNFNNNSFKLVYDFYDNQYNKNSEIRNIEIINNIKPEIDLCGQSNLNIKIIDISFGDISLNLNDKFLLYHPRLLETDINFDLSYRLPEPNITSISNNDISSLIYKFNNSLTEISVNDISFFNYSYKNDFNFELSSNIIRPIINVKIPETNFEGLNDIIHEAGDFLNDASLINNVNVTSTFDKFYYNIGSGSIENITYSYSLFDISKIQYYDNSIFSYIDICFNSFQSDPSLVGNYKLTYTLTDNNNITKNENRNLIIRDTIKPTITTFNGIIDENINIESEYYESGINLFDKGSRLKKLEYFIKKIENNNETDFSSNVVNYLNNEKRVNFSNIKLLNIIDTSNIQISYKIIYNVYDKNDNSNNLTKNIIIKNLNDLILTPTIIYKLNSNSNIIEKPLNSDFFSNSNPNDDISFNYIHSSKTIYYEATKNNTFRNLIDFSFNYILPYNSTRVKLEELLFFNPIESIIPNKLDNYLIFFQIFNNITLLNTIETINFNVIDNKPPELTFISNNNIIDICNIELPYLSYDSYKKLENNLLFFKRLEKDFPIFIYNKNNYEVNYSIPGLNVNDIVNDVTKTLNNETFDISFTDIYDIIVNYYNIEKELSDNNIVTTKKNKFVFNNENFVEKYKTIKNTNYKFKDIKKNNPLGFYIDNCNNYQLLDYINYEPSSNTIDIYVDYSSNINDFVFYDISKIIIPDSEFYFMTDVRYNFSVLNDSENINNHNFGLSGNIITNPYDFSLIKVDSSFEILIPKEANNDINNIFYKDLNNLLYDEKNLKILVTKNNDNYIKYYYNDISFTIFKDISNHNSISIKSYNDNIKNINVFNNDFSSNNIIENNYNIDPSNLLTNFGKYVQEYTITDKKNNKNSINRNISIKSFSPFIEIRYDKDICNNIYKKKYHKQYEIYNDLPVNAYDFSDVQLDFSINSDIFNKNNLGITKKIYNTINSIGLKSSSTLDVHVVNIEIFKKDIDLSSIITDYDLNNPDNNNNNNYKRYGVLKDMSYNILTSIDKPIRIINDICDNNINTFFIENFLDVSFSNLNNIVTMNSDNSLNKNGNKYYYGNIELIVKNDFNRLSIEYLDNNTTKILKDIILYSEFFESKILNDVNKLDILHPFSNIIVTISNENKQYFMLENNNEEAIKQKTLYLPIGKYRFIQNNYKNFFNPIKFSYLPDGHFFNKTDHNLYNIDLCDNGFKDEYLQDISFSSYYDISYQKYNFKRGVRQVKIPGFQSDTSINSLLNNYTELNITPTTPNPLFYYSKNFKNMGGIIYITNNIILQKNFISLNGTILTIDNSSNIDRISYENTNPNYKDNSKNLIFLSQTIKRRDNHNNKKGIIGLTQENINHNMIFLKPTERATFIPTKVNKIIFKKYEDFSKNNGLNGLISDFSYINNYKIKQDNSSNYLYDNYLSQKKSDLFLYDFVYDNRNNSDITNLIGNYSYDINNIFYKNLSNYYYYLKKFNLEKETFFSNTFKYKLSEVGSRGIIEIKNSEEIINIYKKIFFNNNVLDITPFFDNLINLNFEVYIDPSSLVNSNNSFNYYNIEKNKYTPLSDYKNIIDPNNILFEEFIVNIFTDISGSFQQVNNDKEQSIIFTNNNIELNDNLLDSSYTNDLLSNYLHASSDLDLSNMIYLSFKDNDICNNLFCGLTQQNIYHNMYIDNDENKIIFHSYDNLIEHNIVYEINNSDTSSDRITNISKLTNDKNYLIEVSSNDIYNSLIPHNELSDNIYNYNYYSKKNKYNKLDETEFNNNNFKFKKRISYKIYNELESNDNKLNDLYIQPITLNDINYELYPYSYDISLQTSNSYTFKINLNEHLDRNFYNTETFKNKTNLDYNNIFYEKIYYVIKDISYNKNFNLYDSVNNQNIIYDKTKINLLNELQLLLFIMNFKLNYLYEIFSFSQNFMNFNINDYKLIGLNDYKITNIANLISGDFISDEYNLNIANITLNNLYNVVFYNNNIVTNKYEKITQEIYFYDISLIYNNNSVRKKIFNKVDEINQNLNYINKNIDELYKNYYYKIIYSNVDLTNILSYNFFNKHYFNYNDVINEFKSLLNITKSFNNSSFNYSKIIYELNIRGIISYDISNTNFIDLYKFNDINEFYMALIKNMKKLNDLFLYDISNISSEKQKVTYITGHNWDFSINKHYGSAIIDICFNNTDFSLDFFKDLSDSLVININKEFSYNEYKNNYYDKYDLSLLQYFIKEISNNNIFSLNNIEISYNGYFTPKDISVNEDKTNYKDFEIINNDDYYYYYSSTSTISFEDIIFNISGIKILEKDYIKLNFNDSMFMNTIDINYDYIKKKIKFDKINYILNGDELIINSFESNNIVFEIELFYNSYLYPNLYLDTVILDTFIPDLVPPTITFKTEIIDISQSLLENDISSIAYQLINDISFIDNIPDSSFDLYTDISLSYNKLNDPNTYSIGNNNYLNIYIDISQIALATLPNQLVDVIYTIYDKVNNKNIIKRRVRTVDVQLKSIIFKYNTLTIDEYNNQFGQNSFDLKIKKGKILTQDIILRKITAIDPNFNQNINNISFVLSPPFVIDQIITQFPQTYTNFIKYIATGLYSIGELYRSIIVLPEDIEPEPEPEPEPIITKNNVCCYPAVYYKPIQHNYKLGSSNSIAMRMAKFIINS